MDKISVKCNTLEAEYNVCFDNWYQNVFMKVGISEGKKNPCGYLYDEFKACIIVAVKEKKLEPLLRESEKKQILEFDKF